jgi:sugar/nucleoside kinase (ribokinase family)
MPVLVVGSVALDSVETPFGKAEEVLGGSATMFASSACHFGPVQLVGVVGSDYPMHKLEPLRERGVDLSGLEQAEGESFRWRRATATTSTRPRRSRRASACSRTSGRRSPRRSARRRTCSSATSTRGCSSTCCARSRGPKLVACDTMNFWIESRRQDLLDLLGHVDLITLNDAEARQLTEEANLVKAARWIMARGPKHVVIKKGEHGAFLFSGASIFFAPAYPLESIFDPTGAGRLVRGGFIGWLAATDDLSEANMRRAVVYGSAMGSFAVERSRTSAPSRSPCPRSTSACASSASSSRSRRSSPRRERARRPRGGA